MKKLISVFAALALVGSLAAQRGKKPAAKAPAKPAVAAPAVPAAAATVAAIAPAKSGKGIGLTIEGFGLFTLSNGSSATVENGSPATITADVQRKQESQNSSGFGGGATIGYDLVDNLAIVAGFNYRSISGRKYSNSATGGDVTRQTTWNNMGITLGFRPQVKLGPGSLYAGGGWLITLPFTETTECVGNSNCSSASFTAGATYKQEDKWNLGLKGMYGEVGYQFNITDNLYIGIGGKAFVATVDNIDNTQTITQNTGTATSTTITTYKSSASATDITNGTTVSGTTTNTVSRGWSTKGITDISAQVSAGFRF